MPPRILVVDDDRNIGQILHASFSAKGYEVFTARNGEDALTEFAKVRPDLVLLDVLLPKMNGWEVCSRLKATPEGRITPIVLMSAVYKTPKMQLEAKNKYGADEFVEKPFQLSRLMDLVNRFLASRDQTPLPREIDAAGEPVMPAEVERPELPPVVLEGELASVPFPELLHDLYVLNKSGRLTVRSDGKEKRIDVMSGYPVSVTTNIEDEFFGNYLVRQHVVTEEQRDEAVSRMQKSGRLIGTVLIEMDAMSPQQVVNYLRMQVRDKLFEIFSWSAGTYRFAEDNSVTGDIQNVDMSVANIINEGIRRHYRFDRLEPIIEGYADKFLHLGADRRYRFQDLDLTPTESQLLASIDGTRTVRDLMSVTPLPVERSYQIVYTLIVSGMVETVLESREEPQTRFFTRAEVDDQDAQLLAESMTQPVSAADVLAQEVSEAQAPAADSPAAADAGGDMTPPEGKPITSFPSHVRESERAGDEAKTRERVIRFYEKLADASDFQVLGVGDNPTEHEVRVSYHRLAKEFHPDRFFGKSSPEIKAKVEDIFRAVSDAYDRLNTQEKIIQYKSELAGGKTKEDQAGDRVSGVRRVIMAEQRFQAGLQFLKDKRFTRASHAFRESLEVSPNEPEYVAYYGWALYNIPFEKDPDEEEMTLRPKDSMADLQFEARESLNRAISINPRTEKAYLFLGAIYKQQGLAEFAEKQYEKALICNPNSIEALRELRLIKLKEQQSKQKKRGLFDRFLKR
ncbi:response regulator [bacterium]|nr:response regulator [bacterium]